MSTAKSKSKGVDLGQLQAQFEQSERNYRLSEKAFARAGEVRDAAKKQFEGADQALQAAVRSVRG